MENITGLGDLIAVITKFIGVKPWFGCGCDKRRKKLNQLFPFGRPHAEH